MKPGRFRSGEPIVLLTVAVTPSVAAAVRAEARRRQTSVSGELRRVLDIAFAFGDARTVR